MPTLLSLATVSFVALVHIFVGRFWFSRALERSGWLSLAGGISAAYVFIYVLPKLAAKHEVLMRARDTGVLGYLEHHAYLVALAGFLLFYGVDHGVRYVHRQFAPSNRKKILLLVLELQVVVFSAYSVLVGYLIVREQTPGYTSMALTTIALSMHFLGIDHGLWRENEWAYDWLIRWIFAGCLVAGWGLGQLVEVSEPVLALWFAFLAGSITVIVITEEFPRGEKARFGPFAVGAIGYAGLFLVIEQLVKQGY